MLQLTLQQECLLALHLQHLDLHPLAVFFSETLLGPSVLQLQGGTQLHVVCSVWDPWQRCGLG